MSRQTISQHRQQGAALAVSLIMLVVITLVVVGAYTMTSINVKAVGNMQTRDEAVAAANDAIERLITADFVANPIAQGFRVDINNDDRDDYNVEFAAPVCISATQLPIADPPPSSVSLGAAFNVVGAQFFRSIWELVATVTDLSGTGGSVVIHQGVVVLLNQAAFLANCTGP